MSEEDFVAVIVKGPLINGSICAISIYVKESKTTEEKE
jgi:hypothetical protein